MLNVDWFQPFKHLTHNMDKESPTNNIWSPLLEELNQAWASGFNIKSVVSNKAELFHLALLCIDCDILASWKICGFLSKTFFCAKYFLLMKKYCISSKFYHLSNFVFLKLDLSVTSVPNLERCYILAKNKAFHATMWNGNKK